MGGRVNDKDLLEEKSRFPLSLSILYNSYQLNYTRQIYESEVHSTVHQSL